MSIKTVSFGRTRARLAGIVATVILAANVKMVSDFLF
jgi:hypothetical protein